MEPAVHLDAITRDARTVLEMASGALDRPVPPCPGWEVADVVTHLGVIWRWAADTVELGAVTPAGERPASAARSAAPEDRSDAVLLPWASAAAERLVAVLRAADPDAACWTFGLPRTARFWFRRQALETAMHSWDVGVASGVPVALDATVAADGIDEFLAVGLARHLSREPGPWQGESVHLHRTDGEGEWLVRLGPAGSVEVTRAHAKGDVALRGGAADLWLWATNRRTLDETGIEMFGDPAVVSRWREQISF